MFYFKFIQKTICCWSTTCKISSLICEMDRAGAKTRVNIWLTFTGRRELRVEVGCKMEAEWIGCPSGVSLWEDLPRHSCVTSKNILALRIPSIELLQVLHTFILGTGQVFRQAGPVPGLSSSAALPFPANADLGRWWIVGWRHLPFIKAAWRSKLFHSCVFG